MQCKILEHLIRRTQIQIRWVLYGEGHSNHHAA